MQKQALTLLLLLLINLTYVDLHAYSHLIGDMDKPIKECDHDDSFRNVENISTFLLPTNIELVQSNFLLIKDDEISNSLSYSKKRFLLSYYTNLPPPQTLAA